MTSPALSCLSICTSQIYLKAKAEPLKLAVVKEDLSKMINQLEETLPGLSRCDGSLESLQS